MTIRKDDRSFWLNFMELLCFLSFSALFSNPLSVTLDIFQSIMKVKMFMILCSSQILFIFSSELGHLLGMGEEAFELYFCTYCMTCLKLLADTILRKPSIQISYIAGSPIHISLVFACLVFCCLSLSHLRIYHWMNQHQSC